MRPNHCLLGHSAGRFGIHREFHGLMICKNCILPNAKTIHQSCFHSSVQYHVDGSHSDHSVIGGALNEGRDRKAELIKRIKVILSLSLRPRAISTHCGPKKSTSQSKSCIQRRQAPSNNRESKDTEGEETTGTHETGTICV